MAGFDQQVVVLAQRLGIDPPAPRHAQMEDHRAAPVGVNQAIFGPARQAADPCADHRLGEVLRERAAQAFAAQGQAGDRLAV